MLSQEMNLDSHIVTNPLTAVQNPAWRCWQEGLQQLRQKNYANPIFTGAKRLDLDVLDREQKVSQGHFWAMIAP
jgi:hypothetical protein